MLSLLPWAGGGLSREYLVRCSLVQACYMYNTVASCPGRACFSAALHPSIQAIAAGMHVVHARQLLHAREARTQPLPNGQQAKYKQAIQAHCNRQCSTAGMHR